MINKITYKTDEEYRLRQLERQKQKIICECGCILSYSSYRPHQKSNKHKLMLFKITNPIDYENQLIERRLIRKINRTDDRHIKIKEAPIKCIREPRVCITQDRDCNGRFRKIRDLKKYNEKKSMKLSLDVPIG